MARVVLSLAAAVLAVALLAPQGSAMKLVATIGQVTGGSCGYTNFPPAAQLVTGFSEAIYFNGAMCGACYKLQCYGSASCIPKRFINVMVTSICQSTNTTDVCNTGNQALNLDPRAWDLIASTRALGQIPVELFATPCPAVGGVQFDVSVASAYYFQVLIQNVGGMGRLKEVYASANGGKFFPMYRNYGAVWAIEKLNFLGKAISFRLVDISGKAVTLPNVLPATWDKGSYVSIANFKK